LEALAELLFVIFGIEGKGRLVPKFVEAIKYIASGNLCNFFDDSILSFIVHR
jgi:hypothetical protein